jgi:hypothetical protein
MTAARIPTKTISAPDRSQCLLVKVVFHTPTVKREINVKIEDVKRLV